MIYVYDLGWMCNNILQYGHGYAFAREHGLQATSLRFCYKFRYFEISRDRRHNFARYLWAKYGSKLGVIPIVRYDIDIEKDPEAQHKEAFIASGKTVVVKGWHFRCYNLFLKYRSEITSIFAFKRNINRKVDKYLLANESGTPPTQILRLGLHIRRGNYAQWQGGKYYFDDTVYINKIREYALLHPDRELHVYLCGNDRNISREAYRQAVGTVSKLHFMNGNPGEDLCLLSRCDAIIGPPSTFSLVAAMYQDRPLYWIQDPKKQLRRADFKYFEYLFRHII